jgi:hypothetical protein
MASLILPEPTSDALWTACNEASPGDVIQCPSGDYGVCSVPAGVLHAAPFVTIEPAEGADPIISGFSISGQEAAPTGGYIILGFDIRMTPAAQYGVSMGWAQDVTLRYNKVHQAEDGTPLGTGVWIRNSKGVHVYRNEVCWVGDGIDGQADRQGTCDGVEIKDNDLHDIGANFMFFSGLSHLLVQFNYGTNARVIEGVHPDFCQIANSGASISEDIDILENEYERGEGGASQGIFVGDGRRIRVLRNAIRGAQTNGVNLARTVDFEVRENFVQPYADIGSSIIVRQEATNGALIDNSAFVSVGVPGEPQPVNIEQRGNVEVPPATGPDDTQAYDAWRASLEPVPPQPEPGPCDAEKAQIAELQAQVAALEDEVAILSGKIEDAQAALA